MEYIHYMITFWASANAESVPSEGMTPTQMVVFFSVAALVLIPLFKWIHGKD